MTWGQTACLLLIRLRGSEIRRMDTFPVLASNTPWRGVERRRGRGPWREVAALQAAQQEDKGQNAFRTGEGEREREKGTQTEK